MHKTTILIFVIAMGAGYALWDMTRTPPGIAHKTAENARLKPAPDFTFKDMNGKTHTLSDFTGKTILLNIWATWCAPCRIEMPQFLELAQRDQDQLVFVALSVDQNVQSVPKFFKSISPDHQELLKLENVIIGYDTDKSISRDLYGTKLYPETYIITPEMRIHRKIEGLIDWLSKETKGILYPHSKQ